MLNDVNRCFEISKVKIEVRCWSTGHTESGSLRCHLGIVIDKLDDLTILDRGLVEGIDEDQDWATIGVTQHRLECCFKILAGP